MLIQGNTETYEPVTTCRPGGGGAGDIGGDHMVFRGSECRIIRRQHSTEGGGAM